MEGKHFEHSVLDIESKADKITAPEQLLAVQSPIELRKILSDFLKDNEDNKDKLKELVELLDNLEKGIQQENQPVSHIFNLEKIKHLYDTTVVKKNRITFSDFLTAYIRSSAKVLLDKFSRYKTVAEHKQIKKEHLEQEKSAKDSKDKAVTEIKAEIVEEMSARMIPSNYSPEDRQKINNFETRIKTRNRHTDTEQQEFMANTLEQELFLGKIMEEKSLFGPDVPVYHTDKYDDYFNHADLAAPVDADFQILIDLTYSQGDAGEKLHFNRQHPIRNLSYPSSPEIAGPWGIPIVIGMTETDAQDSINQFLENSAKEKLGQINPPSQSELGFQKNMARWFEYVLLQLRYQRDYIQEHLEETNKKGQPIENFEIASKLYEKALDYFQELKKGRRSSVILDEKRPWDSKFSHLEETINDFLARTGRAGEFHPAPDLPDLSFVAK